MMPAITVAIATYNRAHLLPGLFDALAAQATPSGLAWEIVVVDNNSRDDTKATIERLASMLPVHLRYVHETRQGMSHARNRAIHEAHGALIGILDDDVLPARDWVATLARLSVELDADGLGGQILPQWESPPPPWLRDDWRLQEHCFALMKHPVRRQLTYPMEGEGQIWGSNMAFRKSLFDDVGVFDTHHGRGGGKLYKGNEELRLINKALAAGKRLYYDPSLVVHHRIGIDRTSKQYLRKFVFDQGESDAIMDGAPHEPQLAGAPRWLYRRTLGRMLRWLPYAASGAPDAFRREREFLYDAGLLSGYRKARRMRDRA
jgi:glucosyl-dolichyl phosphate glucuronosyltransferase